ncbi:MAG: phosphoribosylaminoimidazolesuccinocarboxamide synthase [Robiginitomaculum sp.]
MSRRKLIYEGKAKILYEGPKPGTLVQYFKDDATAFNAKKKAVLNGKGALNNRISEHFMVNLGRIGIPTHFIKRLNMREQLIKKVDIIPLEVICRNVAAGSICKMLGLEEGETLPRSIIEFCYKKDELNDPLVPEEHILAFGWANQLEIDELTAMTLRINDFMSGMFAAIGIRLIDFKVEFGRYTDENGDELILLADEISPDSCRLWDIETNKKLDKDRFRRDLGDVTEAYAEVATRLGILPKTPPTLSIVPHKD